ncbi:CvpA family protein [Salibacterium salarium]|uniref:CvpA family protein n=1 Tax=Salibacterium salarium TaxID=284579 RepID=A0A3R9P8Z1_9BACI|nr:CvpA family protein [Salibacterium salarium]RSL32994.1 CvpA family protein [Salibacterium salarium]
MLSLLLLLILLVSFFVGLRRGFILQLIHLVSFFIALFIAFYFYQDLAEYLRLWLPYPEISSNGDGVMNMVVSSFDLESVYYAGISFFLLFFIAKILLQIVGSMLDFVSRLPVLRTLNRWLGGVLGLIETYLILFILLITAALMPIEMLQNAINDSWVANVMINHTPILSDWLKDLWSEGLDQETSL